MWYNKTENFAVFLRVHMQVCVFALKREDSSAEYSRRGKTLFLLLPTEQLCVSMKGWRALKKGKEEKLYSHSTVCAFTSHIDVWTLMDSSQVFSPSLLPE